MLKLKKNNLIYVTIIVCSVLFLAVLVSAFRPLTLNILKFPLSLLNLVGREVKGIIFYHQNLIGSERLKKEIDLLKGKLNTATELYLENKRLKDLLSFKQKGSYKVIAARIIGRSPDNWSSVIIIDKGSLHGIRRGFAVINYLGLVGRVIETTQSSSKIILINDPNLSVSGIVQRSRQEGLISGTLGGSLIMRYLPKDADIKSSDIIVTSGLTGTYPKGIIIGRIVSIGEEFSGLSLYAIIRPAVNLSNIEEVLIIIP